MTLPVNVPIYVHVLAGLYSFGYVVSRSVGSVWALIVVGPSSGFGEGPGKDGVNYGICYIWAHALPSMRSGLDMVILSEKVWLLWSNFDTRKNIKTPRTKPVRCARLFFQPTSVRFLLVDI
jgi:hypothetical protein